MNVDPFDSRLDDPLERKRLNKVFTQGLTEEVGYCLPIQSAKGQWRTGQWFLRDERMYLVPGDSAMGYRLPLDSNRGWPRKIFPTQFLPTLLHQKHLHAWPCKSPGPKQV